MNEEVIVTSEFVKNAKHLYRAALNHFKARRDYTNRPIKKYLDKAGAWGLPIGYSFSHLSKLRDIPWYDIEVYAKPETDKESEAAK